MNVWLWLMNAMVLFGLLGLVWLADAAGPWLCGAFLVGFFTCYIGFRCWRFDKADTHA